MKLQKTNVQTVQKQCRNHDKQGISVCFMDQFNECYSLHITQHGPDV